MNGDEPDIDLTGPVLAGRLRKLSCCIHHAKFFLTGCSMVLPGRVVKKIDSFAKRVLREPRRRLCP